MVQGIGGTGSSGSIQGTVVYQTYYKMYKESPDSANLSFEAWLQMSGYMANFTQKIENYLETGDENYGDDNKDTLNLNKHVSNASGALYQSEDDETFYEFDWDSGSYNKLQGKDAAAKALGLPSGKDIDTISLGYMSAKITNYTFGNLDDGQDASRQTVYNKYGNVAYVSQEFDVHYILNALLMDTSDPQYQIAKGIFDDLCTNMNQWLPVAEQEELDKIAAEYGNNSAEYKAKLQEVMLANLDQAGEWIEEHGHVANPNAGSVGDASNLFVDSDGSSENESIEETSTIPEYDKLSIINDSGIVNEYNTGKWSGSNHYDDDTQHESALRDAQTQASAIIDSVINTLATKMGDAYTDEMKSWMLKAKDKVVNNENYVYARYDGHGWLKQATENGVVKTKEMVDAFFTEFDTLCKNNGKTSEEVAAEKKAAEEKSAQEKTDYQTLYNYKMSSIASEAGVKDVQAVNITSAADIKQKAMNEVVQPLIDKIKSKMSGKNVSQADLEKIMNYAAEKALANSNEWASTTNNYVYTIDSSVVVDKFDAALKEAIKAKGYNF